MPLWLQIVIGIISATNFFGFIMWLIDHRQKSQQTREERLQRLNDNLLQNTRNHIDSVFVPINRLLASLESKYGEYKIAQNEFRSNECRKKLNIVDENQTNIWLIFASNKYTAARALADVIKELHDYQEKMISEGTIVYFPPDFEKRFNVFLRFLYGVNTVIHNYLFLLAEVPINQPKVFIPGEPEFEEKLYGEIDYIQEYIRKLALGLIDTTPPTKTEKKFI